MDPDKFETTTKLLQALRECRIEQRLVRDRLQSLLELSSDWFWEQDEHFRFVEITGIKRSASAAAYGKARWDPFFAAAPLEGDWEAHQATLSSHKSFRNFILRFDRSGGEPIYYSVSGQPFFNDEGSFKGYRGVSRDITESKRVEKAVQIED